MKAFLPVAMDVLENLLQEVDVTQEETLDEELKFNLLIIAEVKAVG